MIAAAVFLAQAWRSGDNCTRVLLVFKSNYSRCSRHVGGLELKAFIWGGSADCG